MHLATRRVHIAGIHASPAEPQMLQIARNLTDCDDGFLKGKRVLITDAEYIDGKVQITRVIPEGKKEMAYTDFLRGQKPNPST